MHDQWIQQRIKEKEITPYLHEGNDFIHDHEIELLINDTRHPDIYQVRDILSKSLSIETLTPAETALLLQVNDPAILSEMAYTAFCIKKKVYDNRIVTFAPLYTGNYCVNECLYCGFRRDNALAQRRLLTVSDIQREVEVLTGAIGHKRLIAVYGEHPASDIDYIVKSMQTMYAVRMPTRCGYSTIRRINVNAPPLSCEELQQLRAAGIGTYQVFQETYHHDTYRRFHPHGSIKSHYQWRLYCMHRALASGIDDVGIGALFGLYHWKFEVMALVYHARELEKAFGIGPHTVSFPRLEPACNTPLSVNQPWAVSDDDFKKIITVIRLSIPYAGMILTARETAHMRRDCIALGITQLDASTRIGIGAYGSMAAGQESDKQQFILGDTRSLDEVIRELAQMGFITSFCTAGYRCSRTGKCIMDLLKSGQEGVFCKLNAVLTFREWLDDFASPETKHIGEELITKEMAEIKERLPSLYPTLIEYYRRIQNGERDIYF